MRFVGGGDLRQVLDREGALPPHRVAGFISPVASALDAAHRAGLVHRDVKPASILVVDGRGRPRLADEAPLEFSVTRQRRREDLQRHHPAQPLIAGPEHDGHPAPADPLLQPVTSDV